MSYRELAQSQETLLAEIAPNIAQNADPKAAAVTQMDLLFMLGGYLPAGEDMYGIVPPTLDQLIQKQCERFEGLKPYMTYDLIIDLNSEEYMRTGFMRVFSDGESALHERDFYYGHAMAEPYIHAVAEQLTQLADKPDAESKLAVLGSARDSLQRFSEHMAAYAHLPKDTFGDFRRYLVTYPGGRIRNAGGAFMPSVQLLELALTEPSPTYSLFLEESDKYFPEAARAEIVARRAAASRGANIEERLLSGSLTLSKPEFMALLEVTDAFIHFRMLHLGITKAQIPGAFSSTENLTRKDIANQQGELRIFEPQFEGSAGFDVRSVLANSVYRLTELHKRLVQIGEDRGVL